FRGTVALKTGGTILEVGCGRGVGANLICKVYQPSRLYLLDLDLEMILKASRRINDHNGCRISLCVGDATRLPYADQSLDAVFGFGFLHHVPAWREGLAEVARVLKYGGVYFMEEYYPSLYQNFITKHLLVHPATDRFNSQDLHRAFKDVNLTLTHSFELKRMGILGVGVKADSQSISCAKHEDACQVVLG
ncbi:MAG: class I SAM-dependent methyltransferase, partial [Desulfobacterales bacterium]